MTPAEKLSLKLVIFSVLDNTLKIFFANNFLPKGDFREKESLEKTARRIFSQVFKFAPAQTYLEQLYTFSYPEIKEAGIVIVYYILIPQHLIPKKMRNNWLDVNRISRKTPDFNIIHYASQRLSWKIEYTNVVYSLLPENFTFTELQAVYEAILDKKLDKRNFRKKMFSLKILQGTGKKKKLGKARPAEVFSFKKRKPAFVEIL